MTLHHILSQHILIAARRKKQATAGDKHEGFYLHKYGLGVLLINEEDSTQYALRKQDNWVKWQKKRHRHVADPHMSLRQADCFRFVALTQSNNENR